MTNQQNRQSRLWIGFITGAVVAVLVIFLWWADWFVGLQLQLTDPYYVPIETSGNVVIVAVDDATLQAYGSLLEWSRERYADLIDILADGEARVISFDILFSEPRQGDEAFAEAIKTARAAGVRTVLAVSGQNRTITDDTLVINFDDELKPVPVLAEAANFIAYVNAFPDADGTIRRDISIGEGEKQHYSFSIATYLSYFNLSESLAAQVVTVQGDAVTLPPDVVIPTEAYGLWLQNYFGNVSYDEDSTFKVYSFRDVIEGDVSPDVFNDKIVLVGLSNVVGAVDRYPTPMNQIGEMMPGVEIQANAIETLLSNIPLKTSSASLQLSIIIGMALLTGVIAAHLRWYWMLLFGLGMTLLLGIFASIMFSVFRIILNPLHTNLTIMLTILASIGVRLSLEIIERQRVEKMLESLVLVTQQRMALDRIVPLIASDVRKLTKANTGAIWLMSNGQLQMVEKWGDYKNQQPIGDFAIQHPVSYYKLDVMEVPVIWQGRILAVLAIYYGDLNKSIQQKMEYFAERIGANLDNALLYSQTVSQNQLLQGILAGSPAGIIVLDNALNLIQYNEAAAKGLHVDNRDLVGQPLSAVLEQSDMEEAIWQKVGKNFIAVQPFREEIKLGASTYQWSAAPLSDGERWIITLSDISDLAELSNLKTRMIRMASHDLKNPLGRIMGYGELITEMDGDELGMEDALMYVDRMVQSANEMHTIINEILNLEHVRSGKQQREPLSMENIIQNVIERHVTDMQEKNQIFQPMITQNLPLILGDFNLLVQAVSNLIGNASKYTPDNGEIQLRLFLCDNKIRMEVQDSGYGMPEDAQKGLFTEFYRVRTAKTQNIKGTGLGLSLVKSVLEAHEGKIWVESELDVGSTFYVELPVYTLSD